MQVFIGADHKGFHLKESLKQWLTAQGHDVRDCGAFSYNIADDFPDIAFAVTDALVQHRDARGLFICGSGVGGAIAANKVKGIYCCVAMNNDVVEHSRHHEDCNMLSITSDHTSEKDAKDMIETFFRTAFDPQERFIRRINKIKEKE